MLFSHIVSFCRLAHRVVYPGISGSDEEASYLFSRIPLYVVVNVVRPQAVGCFELKIS